MSSNRPPPTYENAIKSKGLDSNENTLNTPCSSASDHYSHHDDVQGHYNLSNENFHYENSSDISDMNHFNNINGINDNCNDDNCNDDNINRINGNDDNGNMNNENINDDNGNNGNNMNNISSDEINNGYDTSCIDCNKIRDNLSYVSSLISPYIFKLCIFIIVLLTAIVIVGLCIYYFVSVCDGNPKNRIACSSDGGRYTENVRYDCKDTGREDGGPLQKCKYKNVRTDKSCYIIPVGLNNYWLGCNFTLQFGEEQIREYNIQDKIIYYYNYVINEITPDIAPEFASKDSGLLQLFNNYANIKMLKCYVDPNNLDNYDITIERYTNYDKDLEKNRTKTDTSNFYLNTLVLIIMIMTIIGSYIILEILIELVIMPERGRENDSITATRVIITIVNIIIIICGTILGYLLTINYCASPPNI